MGSASVSDVPQHAATRYNKLQHTATRCNTLQHAATRCNTLQHAATYAQRHQRLPLWFLYYMYIYMNV